MNLTTALQQAGVWRGSDHAFHQAANGGDGLRSGYTELDKQLPFGGWPTGALTEILHDHAGRGELSLLMPALSRLTHHERFVAMIDPPWTPYAPALSAAGIHLPFFISIGPLNKEDRLWTLEQVLRAGHCGAVLSWPQDDLNLKALRRLQLAAEAGHSSGFLFRPQRYREQHSPAALRLRWHHDGGTPQVEVLKCRGRHFNQPFLSLGPEAANTAAQNNVCNTHGQPTGSSKATAETPCFTSSR